MSVLGIITTQKMWNLWELLSKICSFWVVIIFYQNKNDKKMRNQLDNSPLACNIIPPFGPFHIVTRNFHMIMQNGNIWFLSFLLSFLPFPSLDSTSTTSKSTPNPDPNKLHYLFHHAFGSSSTLFVIFNLIHFFCHQFIKIIPWNDSKTS